MKHSNSCWWGWFSLGPWAGGTHVPCAAAEITQGWFHGHFKLNKAKAPMEKGVWQRSRPAVPVSLWGGWVREQIQLEISSAWEALGRSRIARAVLGTGVLSSGSH